MTPSPSLQPTLELLPLHGGARAGATPDSGCAGAHHAAHPT